MIRDSLRNRSSSLAALRAFPYRGRESTLPALLAPALATAVVAACGSNETTAPPPAATDPGEQLFTHAFPNTNGRTCATCHVPEDGFTLTPDHVARVFAENPNDPLFAAIDADDPNASPLTFEHLKKGLIRVVLQLPDNVDVIDAEGNLTTPPDRHVFVWRGVPSIADTALTAPYQLDGRVATLEEQAQGALTGHSEGGVAEASELADIAAFERNTFTSERSRQVAEELARGVPFAAVTDVDAQLELTPEEARGSGVYEKVCAT